MIITTLQRSLGRLLNIRPGEWRMVLLLQLQVFLIIGVLLLAKPAGSAVFIARYGAGNLPWMFVLTAIVAAILSTALAAALQRYSLSRVNFGSLGFCLVSLLVFGLLLEHPRLGGAAAIGLYLWVALFGVLAASQFWMVASQVFDVRQAKRLFGPIGAGAIAGGIVGGYVANLVAATYGLKALLLVAVLALLAVMLIGVYIHKVHATDAEGAHKKADKVNEHPYQIIRKSRHLLLLCSIIALSVITAKLVDYQFSVLAAARYATPDRLTAFFGFWFSTFNVVGLIIQLLLTQRVIRQVGISGALFILPAGLGAGALLMMVLPGLGAATASRLVDGSLKQSLHRAGVEMLFLPVDRAVKNRIKIFIDVLIDSVAGGIGGLLLLLLGTLGVSTFGISGLVLALSFTWGICVLLVREEYLAAFRSQLSHLRPRPEKTPLRSRHREVLAGFLEVLERARFGESEQQAIYVLERTEDLTEARFRKSVEALLDSPSGAIRAKALQSLALRSELNLLLRIVPMLNDADDRVKTAALEYLVTHHLEETEELLLEQLKHPDAAIGGTALVHLLLETRKNPALRERWQLDAVFAQRVADLPWLSVSARNAWRHQLLAAAGRSGTALGNEYIKRELNCGQATFRNAAIIATGESLDRRWVYSLLDLLSEPDYRPQATSALVQYGARLFTILVEFLEEGIIEIRDIRRLPALLVKMNSPEVVGLLFSLVERYATDDLELRLEVYKTLNVLQRLHPDYKISARQVYQHLLQEVRISAWNIDDLELQAALMAGAEAEVRTARQGVMNILAKRRQGNLERLFRLLRLRYPPADVIPAYRGLCSEDHEERINALEFMDVMLEKDLQQLLIPVMEYGIRTEASGFSLLRNNRLEKEEANSYRRILQGSDIRLKLATIYLIGQLHDVKLRDLLHPYRHDADPRIRDMVGRVLADAFPPG